MSEARIREVIREQVATSMAEFMTNMNRGAGGNEAGGAGAGGGGAGGAGVGGGGPVVLEPVVPDHRKQRKGYRFEISNCYSPSAVHYLGGMEGLLPWVIEIAAQWYSMTEERKYELKILSPRSVLQRALEQEL
ncbi:hypothetical protein Tco_0951315 [Tanacetum coccineum]|uniref:Uncharacterized protein n=1 Tax=Tanacetum coccineum TaxID=301880 RepID=A0ABQ5DTT1_9ASTR